MLTFYQYFVIYLVSVPIFFAIDMVWLGVVAQKFYQDQLGYLLGPVQWPVAIAFYLLFLVGLTVFVIGPAVAAQSFTHALIFGAFFGLITYATYDLTNWATIKDWPALVSIVDMAWGTVLSASVATSTFWIVTQFILK